MVICLGKKHHQLQPIPKVQMDDFQLDAPPVFLGPQMWMVTLPKFNMEPRKWHLGIGDSFWQPSFLGSMFNFGEGRRHTNLGGMSEKMPGQASCVCFGCKFGVEYFTKFWIIKNYVFHLPSPAAPSKKVV